MAKKETFNIQLKLPADIFYQLEVMAGEKDVAAYIMQVVREHCDESPVGSAKRKPADDGGPVGSATRF